MLPTINNDIKNVIPVDFLNNVEYFLLNTDIKNITVAPNNDQSIFTILLSFVF